MTPQSIDAAAQLLFDTRKARAQDARLSDALRPRDSAEALAIQQRVGTMLGVGIGAWKCSVPTAEKPSILAPIFAPTVRRDSPCPIALYRGAARVEPEVAFEMGKDLPPRGKPYSDDEIRSAIGQTRLVLELIGARYPDQTAVSFPELLADGIANQGLFVGPAVAAGLDEPLEAFPISVDSPQGRVVARDGKHPDGHPLRPLLWLANFLASGGYAGVDGLKAGQVVTTGSYCGVLEVPLDTRLSIRYGELGTLAVEFTLKA